MDTMFEQLLLNLSCGAAIISSELRFVAINAPLAAMNGVPAQEHLGRTVREVTGETANIIEPALQHVLANGEVVKEVQFIVHLPNRPSKAFWKAEYHPLRDSQGSISRIAAIIHELTNQKKMENLVDELAQKLPWIRDHVYCLELPGKEEPDYRDSWMRSMQLLKNCISQVRDCRGQIPIQPRATVDALNALRPSSLPLLISKTNDCRDGLAPRETETVRLLAWGRSVKEIGAVLGISSKTVETYRVRAMSKLDLRSTADLVRYAVSRELVEPWPAG
jgi:DNA-binding CsgD family transcriptional regulator